MHGSRPIGQPTRGTTSPNRLRRIDRWIVGTQSARLRDAVDPLVIDLGYGAHPVTTVELAQRLAAIRPNARVLGLEIDPARVTAATTYADPPRLDFARGGFELAGHRPVLVRACNVLRQYDEAAVRRVWDQLASGLAPGGVVVEGTCDEIGRRAAWVALDATGPLTLTLSCRVAAIERPSDLAERLPKALIHHNLPGKRIHDLLTAFDDAWTRSAAYTAFGPRQRWMAAAERLATSGWPVIGGRRRWRLGELTVRWDAVSP